MCVFVCVHTRMYIYVYMLTLKMYIYDFKIGFDLGRRGKGRNVHNKLFKIDFFHRHYTAGKKPKCFVNFSVTESKTLLGAVQSWRENPEYIGPRARLNLPRALKWLISWRLLKEKPYYYFFMCSIILRKELNKGVKTWWIPGSRVNVTVLQWWRILT